MLATLDHQGGPARIVYLGTPAIAVPPLRSLVEAGHDVALVVTNPDRRRGRGGELSPSPVKAAALELGLPVSHEIDDVLEVGAAFGVVVAFGKLIAVDVLEQLPMVNIHFSLLPRWRGAAPLEWAILSGDEVTGTCLMQVAEGMDEGAVWAQRELVIGERNLDQLRDALVDLSCALLVDTLADGFGRAEPQQGDPVHARKLTIDDHRLDPHKSASELERVVRLGRAWTTIGGKRLRVHDVEVEEGDASSHTPGAIVGERVATADGFLRLVQVQPEGRRRSTVADWLNGARLADDATIGS